MGLQLRKFINRFGYEVSEGYFELFEVTYNSKIKLLQFIGDIYLSKEHKDMGFRPIDSFEDGVEFDEMPEGNLFDFSYKYIIDRANKKSEEDFKYKGFIDCKEVD